MTEPGAEMTGDAATAADAAAVGADDGGAAAGPVAAAARITSLDLIRGVAVLGILLMNAVSFKYGLAPYLNLSAGGSVSWLDWAVGFFGEIFIDQKFMALFSMLFGAGILLFIERAQQRGGRAARLNLWRNALLLGIGVLHSLLWDGDVLVVYALSAVVLLALRNLPGKALIAVGAGIFLLSVPNLLLVQYLADNSEVSLAGLWEPGEPPGVPSPWLAGSPERSELAEAVFGMTLLGYLARGLGLILLGAGLYRLGFMQGRRTARAYRLTAAVGLGIGLPLAAAGAVGTHWADYSREVAFLGQAPNTLGTIPAALGMMSLIILWNRTDGRGGGLKRRLRAVGRMALTNYLAQTVIGVTLLTVLLGGADINRSGVLLFCLAVWALQLWWSPWWLARYRLGPAEWLWRAATYRRGQPLRIRN